MCYIRQLLPVSERRVCRVLGQPRSTQRYRPRPPDDEDRLTERIVELASRYGRYGYQRITWLLQAEGWRVNHKRVERIWRQEGLKVPRKQPKRGRLWLADGSCLRRRPECRHHVWSYDFVSDRTADSRPLKMLTLIDEYSRQCLAIRVQRRMQSIEVLETLAECFIAHGRPTYIRSENGPELKSKLLVDWLTSLGVQPLFIEPGSPWEMGYIESFNARLRDELLNGEMFCTLTEAQVIVEQWRQHYNTRRPHSALGGQPPTPAAFLSPGPTVRKGAIGEMNSELTAGTTIGG